MKLFGRAQRSLNRIAFARFPSLTVAAALAFHVGTAFSSSRIISKAGDFEAWEVFVGAVGFVHSLLLPPALAAYPYLRIGRAFQEYQGRGEWLLSKGLPAWALRVLPEGAIFSLETRQAYGPPVNDLRSPPKQIVWTSLGTWTSLVFLVAGLFHPNQIPQCQALLACIGIVFIAIAAALLILRP